MALPWPIRYPINITFFLCRTGVFLSLQAFVALSGLLLLGAWIPFYIAASMLKYMSHDNEPDDRNDERVWPKKINWEPLRLKIRKDAEADKLASIDHLSPSDPHLDIRSDGGAYFARPEEDLDVPPSPFLLEMNSYPTASSASTRSRASSVSPDLEIMSTRLQRGKDSFIYTPEEVKTLRERRLSIASLHDTSPTTTRTPASLSPQSNNTPTEFVNGGSPTSIRFGDQSPVAVRSGRTTPVPTYNSNLATSSNSRRDSRQQPNMQHNRNSSTTSLSSVPEINGGIRRLTQDGSGYSEA